jgi:hypothetical protein
MVWASSKESLLRERPQKITFAANRGRVAGGQLRAVRQADREGTPSPDLCRAADHVPGFWGAGAAELERSLVVCSSPGTSDPDMKFR